MKIEHYTERSIQLQNTLSLIRIRIQKLEFQAPQDSERLYSSGFGRHHFRRDDFPSDLTSFHITGFVLMPNSMYILISR